MELGCVEGVEQVDLTAAAKVRVDDPRRPASGVNPFERQVRAIGEHARVYLVCRRVDPRGKRGSGARRRVDQRDVRLLGTAAPGTDGHVDGGEDVAVGGSCGQPECGGQDGRALLCGAHVKAR